MSHKAEGEFGCRPVTWNAVIAGCAAHQMCSNRGFMQSTSPESDSPAHIWIIYSDARRLNKGPWFIPGDTCLDGLFVGVFCGFTAHFPARLEQSCCEVEESGAIFLALNHSIPSARWSLLINHVTMFHNLGITASMSLITICALLEGSQRPKR